MRKPKKTTLLASKSLLKYPYKPFFACAGRAPPGSGHLCGEKRQKPRGFMRERPQNSRTLVFLNGSTTNPDGDQGLPRQSGETRHQYPRTQTTSRHPVATGDSWPRRGGKMARYCPNIGRNGGPDTGRFGLSGAVLPDARAVGGDCQARAAARHDSGKPRRRPIDLRRGSALQVSPARTACHRAAIWADAGRAVLHEG